jgi:hypothetical protein
MPLSCVIFLFSSKDQITARAFSSLFLSAAQVKYYFFIANKNEDGNIIYVDVLDYLKTWVLAHLKGLKSQSNNMNNTLDEVSRHLLVVASLLFVMNEG